MKQGLGMDIRLRLDIRLVGWVRGWPVMEMGVNVCFMISMYTFEDRRKLIAIEEKGLGLIMKLAFEGGIIGIDMELSMELNLSSQS